MVFLKTKGNLQRAVVVPLNFHRKSDTFYSNESQGVTTGAVDQPLKANFWEQPDGDTKEQRRWVEQQLSSSLSISLTS